MALNSDSGTGEETDFFVLRAKGEVSGWIFIEDEESIPVETGKLKYAMEFSTAREARECLVKLKAGEDFDVVPYRQAQREYSGGGS